VAYNAKPRCTKDLSIHSMSADDENLAPRESKNLNSSSKSFVGLAILRPPAGAKLLDNRNALVGGRFILE
jgi:hypothetical protein